MSARNNFSSNLASLFSVGPEHITITPTNVQIGSHTIEHCLTSVVLEDLLTSTQIASKDSTSAIVEWKGHKYTLTRLQKHESALVEHGIIHWPDQATWVFTGSFGATKTAPNLDVCPPLLLPAAIWQPESAEMVGFDWASLLPLWGPTSCTYESDAPRERLAMAGYAIRPSNAWRQPFVQLSTSPLLRPNSGTTQEARDAFVSALQSTDGPDTAFVRLYRVFEVEFAHSTQRDLANAPIPKVLTLLRNIQSTSELDTLRKVFDRSTTAFTRFSRSDWDTLFGIGHKPRRDAYQSISKWLEDPKAIYPTDKARAALVYYVRNALVHAKLQEGDAVLLPPFSIQATESLCHLYEDCVDVVRNLLFV